MDFIDSLRRPSWTVVLLGFGWLALFFIGAYVISPAGFLSIMKGDLAIRASAAAAIISTPQVSATLLGVPLGMYLDKINSERAIPIAGVIILVGGVLDWVAGTQLLFLPLIGTRLFSGAGMIVFWIIATNIISSSFTSVRRATAVAIFITGYPAGYAFGQVTSPILASQFGWPLVFPVFTTVAFCFILMFYLIQRQVPKLDTPDDTPNRKDFMNVFLNRNVVIVSVLSFLGYSLYMVFNSWMPAYFSNTFGLSFVDSGLLVALFPAVGIAARPVGGWLSDGFFGHRRRPIFFISFVGTILLSAVMWEIVAVEFLAVLLMFLGFVIQMQFGLLYQYVQEFVETNVAGTSISIVSVTGWLGSFVAPVVVGELIIWFPDAIAIFGSSIAIGIAGVLFTSKVDEPLVSSD